MDESYFLTKPESSPAQSGIQKLINDLDSGFHRSDDFLRDYHMLINIKYFLDILKKSLYI